ncbi:hypothetical protein MR626_01130 [bacterium]|nr:hypothetical protein [bacterium]
MRKKDLETRLRQACQVEAGEVRSSSVSKAVLLARKEAISRRQRISFLQFLSMQIRFIGWKVWAVQGASLLAVCWLLSHLFGQGYWKDPQSVAGLLVCLSLLTFMTAPPFLYRSVRYRMQEVEAAAGFSSARLLMARLIIIGIGDGALLSGIVLTAAAKTALQPGSAVVSVALPFLLASSGCLYLLGHVCPRQFLGGSMGLCGFLLVGLSLAHRHFHLFFRLSPGWIGVCALLIAFCCHQFHYLLHNCAYAEMQVI